MSRSPAPIRERPRVAVLLAWQQDPVAWRERHQRGETMDETPYGYERGEGSFEMTWAVSHPESSLARRIRRRLAAWCGFDIVHAWRNRRLLFSADAVWTHTEREHLAVALLQRLRWGRCRVPVIAQSVWLWDEWSAHGALRRAFIAWLLRAQAIEVTHSRLNVAASDREVPGRKVALLPFGTAPAVDGLVPSEPVATQPPMPFVFAVGNDVDRDWETLAAAAAAMPHLRFRVASSSRKARGITWPTNVQREPTASKSELAELYQRADVVVVPVQANLHASGATSCIEALAARRPLVVTRAGGLEDYVSDDAILVPPADAHALADALALAVGKGARRPARDARQQRGLTQEDYVARYILATRWALGQTTWDDAVSRFGPVAEAR